MSDLLYAANVYYSPSVQQTTQHSYISMSECSVDIKIGTSSTESKQLYKSLEFVLQLQQEKLAKHNHQLCNMLNKTSTPFIVIEYPQPEVPEGFDFRPQDYDCGVHRAGGKSYHYANPRSKETIKLLKNVEKEFQKLARFDNSASFRLSLYDPLRVRPEGASNLDLLNRARLKGQLHTDHEFIGSLVELMRRVSNEFLNSPIMALLELLEQCSFRVELEPIELFPQDLQARIRSWLDFSPWLHPGNLAKWAHLKGEIEVSFNLPKLLCLKVRGEIAVLGRLLLEFAPQ